ncbi:cytochrome P450 [Streptomyces sp. BE147]|uniref:cytochrome P450 n=1 Tax=unclassified Streptomyces TaxID=2593676 RepID=UPI002E78D785|nr:cytochrome P450 [Streptomyces sp. BE147]MEE1740555.1 cytochrome P450 [Streptomyces sp. BE147]
MLIRIGNGKEHGPPPPGPRLPRPVQTVVFTWWRHTWAKRLRDRYGDIVSLRVFPWRTVILVMNSEHIGAMFGAPASLFHVGEGNRVLTPVFGEQSLLTSDDEQHRRLRRLMVPLFGKTAVRGYRSAIRELTEKELERWPLGVPFRSLDRMRALSLDIIWRIIFGPDRDARLDETRALVDRLPVGQLTVLIGLNSSAARRVVPWKRAAALLARFDSLIHATIAERRKAPDLREREDMLSRLICAGDAGERLSDAEIRDQIITLLLAGHEPTATTLAWALHELARDPRVARDAVRAALVDDSAYLEAVVKESLRRRPAIFESIWTLTEDIELAGFRLPEGATLMPLIGIVHMDTAHYPDAEAFRPERFLDKRIPPHAFIPFGGGARRCIGAYLSVMQSVEVLGVLLSARAISTDRPKPEAAVLNSVTMAPAGGARIIARPLARIEQTLR